jgi:putative colanic acid biosynthesis UDP-glucose lipid carrier transferase
MTGWAQVNGWRGTMTDEHHLRERIAHDLFYIRNWSPLLDLRILVLTAWTVVVGRNSY